MALARSRISKDPKGHKVDFLYGVGVPRFRSRHLEGGTIKEVVEQQGRVHSTECNSNGQRIPELTERNIP